MLLAYTGLTAPAVGASSEIHMSIAISNPGPARPSRSLAVRLSICWSIWGPAVNLGLVAMSLALFLPSRSAPLVAMSLLVFSQLVLHLRRRAAPEDAVARLALLAGYWHVALYAAILIFGRLAAGASPQVLPAVGLLAGLLSGGLHLVVAFVAQVRALGKLPA
ncbi:hypothetical protein D3C71_25870 [compost metagenome]